MFVYVLTLRLFGCRKHDWTKPTVLVVTSPPLGVVAVDGNGRIAGDRMLGLGMWRKAQENYMRKFQLCPILFSLNQILPWVACFVCCLLSLGVPI